MTVAQTEISGDGNGGDSTAVATAREYPDNIKALGDTIAGLTLNQVVPLQDYLKDTYGIEAPEGVGSGFVGQSQVTIEPVEEQTHFDVMLTGFDAAKKMGVIKEIRDITKLGLKEAKDAVEGSAAKAVPLKEGVAKEEAEAMQKKLTELGAKIELK